MSRMYWRAIPLNDPARSAGAQRIAGGWLWFDRVEKLTRGAAPEIVEISEVPADVLAQITAPRPDLVGLNLSAPRVMAILNTTPDSFSDGGKFSEREDAIARARALAAVSDILDIGGESTRPGADLIARGEEIARTKPVIAALRHEGLTIPISIDTRKSHVADAALEAGADLINDVTAMEFDPAMASLAASSEAALCLMHMRGTPDTMTGEAVYDDVLLDVYDYLEARRDAAIAAGVRPGRILLDPGIGFAKDEGHNLALTARLSLFHSLGCPILYGASRKRFVGSIGQEPEAAQRLGGSLAVHLAAVAQGAQIIRVHDAAQMRQALRLWQAVALA
ncbi:dihydropteroate synthase [Falsigemmobacter faecalis]|uniref:Dihydropteroate synthase n=1 Tax=Falsigemmobacter faecalis TaxID=2488730 RepID=A0A3P3DTW6_9RHOB|nr:dihydropteroate synthase [Falsigemmobacter faecalis]RRH77384.1 dihydropteroate synthase [Falsigemmobacter faecalis]